MGGVDGRGKLMIGVVYVNPEGVRVEDTERLAGRCNEL